MAKKVQFATPTESQTESGIESSPTLTVAGTGTATGSETTDTPKGKSGWARAGEVIVPALGWATVAGVIAYSVKCAMKQTDARSWREAQQTLEAFELCSTSFQEDRLLYVLFRDLVTSCHIDDLESREWCRRAFYRADALLHLEATLRSDGRVNAAFADSDQAEKFAREAVHCLLQVQPARTKEHYMRLRGARKKLQQAMARHMRTVMCLVMQ
jgi:hypothetical protein